MSLIKGEEASEGFVQFLLQHRYQCKRVQEIKFHLLVFPFYPLVKTSASALYRSR